MELSRSTPTPNRSGGFLDRTGLPRSEGCSAWGTYEAGDSLKKLSFSPSGMMVGMREKVMCFASPVRLSIFEVALPVSDNGKSTTSSLFLTWCLSPRPNVGIVVSPDCAGTLAFKHGRRVRRTSGNELDPAFLPGFTWVF